MSLLSGKEAARSPLLAVGERLGVLAAIESDVLIAHVAEEKQQKYPYEVLFRSQTRMLMDNSASEYLFVSEFFNLKGDAAQDMFDAIFDTTVALAQVPTVVLYLCALFCGIPDPLASRRCVPTLRSALTRSACCCAFGSTWSTSAS